MLIVQIVLTLLVIVAASELFTNALEHLGARLGISEGVTGSIFAAVGTALPETLIPLLALAAGTPDRAVNEEIGVGAILGAPLMLSTLSLSLLALVSVRRRGLRGRFRPERSGLARDLDVFLVAFVLATAMLFVPHRAITIRVAVSAILVTLYFIYLLLTLRASTALVDEGHGTRVRAPLFLARLRLPAGWVTTCAQLAGAVLLLVAGARGFIEAVHQVSARLGASPLLLSLLLVPVATELPEKLNSIIWIRGGKDTLSFGNITGAMVFQGTLLPALGITLTPWTLRPDMVVGTAVTLAAAAWVRLALATGGLRVWHLLLNAALYVLYLVLVLRL
ncbi:MAG TPA: sodium:calcium antiporter [Gammaproteobacteria bacterium]|nr:sodium:calcium antiporter [Gammaproteobacteria bacterium]